MAWARAPTQHWCFFHQNFTTQKRRPPIIYFSQTPNRFCDVKRGPKTALFLHVLHFFQVPAIQGYVTQCLAHGISLPLSRNGFKKSIYRPQVSHIVPFDSSATHQTQLYKQSKATSYHPPLTHPPTKELTQNVLHHQSTHLPGKYERVFPHCGKNRV